MTEVPSIVDFNAHGYAQGSQQYEILRAIWHQGGITSATCEAHGFTRKGLPQPALRDLITHKIVAPRVLTSQPLRVVFQMRASAFNRNVDMQIAHEARRLRLKEHADGGFSLELRREIRHLKT